MKNWFGRGKRRNPTVLGLNLENGLAGAVGIYLTKTGGDGARSVLPQAAKSLDNIRPGLSTPVAELVAAVVLNKVAEFFSFTRKYRAPAILGASALVVNDALLAATGQFNLIGGTPSWALGLRKSDADPKASLADTGGLSRPLLGPPDGGTSANARVDRSYGRGF